MLNSAANSFFSYNDTFDAYLCSWYSSFLTPPSHLSANFVTHTSSMPSIQLFLTTFTASTTILVLDCINNLLTLRECFNLPHAPDASYHRSQVIFVKTQVKLGYFPLTSQLLCFLALPQILEAASVSGPSRDCRRICLGLLIPDIYMLLSPTSFSVRLSLHFLSRISAPSHLDTSSLFFSLTAVTLSSVSLTRM